MNHSPRRGAALFRGWIVVGAAFTSLMVIFGTAYSFAAFFKSWADEFAATRAEVSWVFGLASLLYFMLGAVGGALADRFGPRATGVAGMLALSGGLLLSSWADGLLGVYLAYGLGMGLGIALVYTPAMGAVQPWFVKRRGMASGIASAGIGAGTLIVPVLATSLIDAYGWRAGVQLMAGAALSIGLAAAWLLERDPAAHGWQADGVPLPDGPGPSPAAALAPATGSSEPLAAAGHAAAGLSLRETVSSTAFRWLYATVTISTVSMMVPFAHLSAAARDLGVVDTAAVALVGLIGTGSLLGRFLIGALADRLGLLRTHALLQAALGASFLLWALAGGYPMLALFALLFGLSYGGIVSLLPPICSGLFGLRAVSGIIGLLYSGSGIGALIGPVAAGALFDRFQHYGATIVLCLLCSAAATACAWRVCRLAGRPA